MRSLVVVCACLVLVGGAPARAAARLPQPGQTADVFTYAAPNGRVVRLNYLLFLPRGYGAGEARLPLLVFLHGSREAGRDINRLRRAILPQLVEANPDFPFIVLSPQSPSATYGWYPSLKAIHALIDEIEARYAVDPARIYLTGLSMGGFGAWALALERPGRFAAIAPVVGGYFYNPRQLCALKGTPIWVFGARRDRNVPLRESERVVKALQACGAAPRFTVFEDADHDQGWLRAYTETGLFDWLAAQRLGQPLSPQTQSSPAESLFATGTQ
ncbi:MAG: alpha/beta hydrolase-fold protein [Anaerolineae bacterium]|nr:alpha/beta hydrolase-fold protein [Thermoflexales bacterium]MDW8396853.1 alpha/beta hydrolase-fold protein [Anaerolineae bacterium]